jgi:hypothetical protein
MLQVYSFYKVTIFLIRFHLGLQVHPTIKYEK